MSLGRADMLCPTSAVRNVPKKTDNRSIMTTEQGSQTEREPRVVGKQWSIGVRRGIHLLRHIAESAGRGTETATT
jgi:hypothetical protein